MRFDLFEFVEGIFLLATCAIVCGAAGLFAGATIACEHLRTDLRPLGIEARF